MGRNGQQAKCQNQKNKIITSDNNSIEKGMADNVTALIIKKRL